MLLRCWWSLLLLVACAAEGPAFRADAKPGLVTDKELEDLRADLGDDAVIGRPLRRFARTADQRGAEKGAAADAEATAPVPAAERMLIQRGELRLEVPRPAESAAAFQAQVVEWGGYLQQQQQTSYTFRLPAARFETAYAWLRQHGRVLAESRSADDVTEEFVDLGIRLDNARKSRERLLEILQKADKVEDILRVEAELRRLTEEIERMEGRRKFLADQVAMATLTAEFRAVAAPPPPKPRPKQPSRFPWINRVGAERVVEDF